MLTTSLCRLSMRYCIRLEVYTSYHHYNHNRFKHDTSIKVNSVRGMKDVIGVSASLHRHIQDTAYNVATLYGCREIITPSVERLAIFRHTLGSSSDVVSKELFAVNAMESRLSGHKKNNDKDCDELCLRPEGTAGAVRAIIQSKDIDAKAIQRFYYQGGMYRHERPQKGRLRQFTQIGIEMLGETGWSVEADAILSAARLLHRLGIAQHCRLYINSLGSRENLSKYTIELNKFLSLRQSELSIESQRRFSEGNSLRVLDSKSPLDIAVVKDAPMPLDNATVEECNNFKMLCEAVKSGCDALATEDESIEIVVDKRLVRGLDYYTGTVFEFISTVEEASGAQNALLGGGRYDGLMSQMGGPDTCAVGWAAGVERIALLLNRNFEPKVDISVSVILLSPSADSRAIGLDIAEKLRTVGVTSGFPITGSNIQPLLKRAVNLGSKAVIILGPDELKTGVVGVKLLDSCIQHQVALSELHAFINKHIVD